FDGELIHVAAHHNFTEEALEVLRTRFPSRLEVDTIVSRTLIKRTAIHIEDASNDSVHTASSVAIARRLDYRGQISVPMLREGKPIGNITLAKRERGLFTD